MYSAQENNKETQSAGFSWGYSLAAKPQEPQQEQQQEQGTLSLQIRKDTEVTHTAPCQPRYKRQYDDVEGEGKAPSARPDSAPVLRKYMVAKKRPSMLVRTTMTPHASENAAIDTFASDSYVPSSFSGIEGQALPMPRSLELMDKAQLQNVIMDLVNVHPQVSQYLQSSISQYSFSNEKRLQALRHKLQAVYAAVPYNRNYANDRSAQLDDYAFVRIKPLVLEFLNCLTDYILAAIPPRATNIHESLVFLDACTEMVTELPRFQLPSNNYYNDKCLEQLSYIWCTLIEHMTHQEDTGAAAAAASTYPGLLLQADSICEKLQIYNTKANNLLARPIQLLKHLTAVGRQESIDQQQQQRHQNFNILTSNHSNTL